MRNKNDKVQSTLESSHQKPHKKGEFAMIIEENSPTAAINQNQVSNRTLSSSKRAS